MSTSPGDNYGIVLLAAGSSSRLGEPKQLLILNGVSLVKKMAEIALEVTLCTVVVIGACAEKVAAELNDTPIEIVENKFFEDGIASSIHAGLNALMKTCTEIKGAIFIVCDQPFISSKTLLELIEKKNETDKGIVASEYARTWGTPVLFKPKYFKELLELKGDAGAKKLIGLYPGDVAIVDFPLGEMDIDTMEDYKRVSQKNNLKEKSQKED